MHGLIHGVKNHVNKIPMLRRDYAWIMKDKFFLKRESLSSRLLYSIFNKYHSVTIGKSE